MNCATHSRIRATHRRSSAVVAFVIDRFERLEQLAHEALADDDPWRSFEQFIRTSAKIQTEDRALSEVLTSRPEIMTYAAQRVKMLDLVSALLKRAQKAGAVRKD